jgi:hypothetical protein
MLEQNMRGLQERFDGLDSRVAGLDSRVGALESQVLQLRHEIKHEISATRSELRAEIGGASASILKALDETNTLMRVLHEDAISRIATMGDGKRRRGR